MLSAYTYIINAVMYYIKNLSWPRAKETRRPKTSSKTLQKY